MKINIQLAGTLCATSILGFSCINPPAGQTKKPNVIFFIADDMSKDMFNFLDEGKDSNLTPNIDKLASEGTLLMGQHVVSPVCTPSRFNCLTGTYASRATNQIFLTKMEKSDGQTVVEWNSFITASNVTIGNLLQEAGYSTGFVGKNHAIEVPDVYVPDDFFGNPEDPEIKSNLQANAERFRKVFAERGFNYAERIYDDNPIYIGLKALSSHNLDWITEGGLEFIEQNKENPFFLYFATTTPHGPYEIERSWGGDRRITSLGIMDEPVSVLSSKEEIEDRLKKAGFDYKNSQLASKGNVLWLDDALGALINKLKEIGEYENTIIFFFNDQGQSAKGTVYQGGTYNPSLVWKFGGFEVGSKTNELISNVDFAPTILDLLDIETEYNDFDGKSFAQILEGNQSPIHSSLYFELGYARGVRKGNMKYMAIRYPEYVRNYTLEERAEILKKFNEHQLIQDKKVHHTDPSLPYSHLQIIPGGGDAEQVSISKYACYYDADQLYDLSLDPNEQNNLFYNPEYAEVALEMKAELKKYLVDLPGNFADLKEDE
ncbi:MAG: sulfatase-like hydrolase/transferase [Bacteroidales bacterium]|nr:sulfatase-like hydrolase/transferase [Bacteroidales bacterium]MCF8391412.1 sulfatase-like hydrolase/transferase [Bacteroidales bacterium]